MRKVKWGVLGTADIARGCTIPGMQQAENCELYAVAGRSLEKAQQFKEMFGFEKAYGDYNELLSDPEVEAVYIPLPNQLHYEWVIAAIDAGKHVLCEKPITPTAEMAKKLFQHAKEKNVFLMEAFAYLQTPYIAAVKKEIEEESFGKVDYIESAFLTPGYDGSNIRMQKACYGGALYDLGCYCTSMITWMLGKIPVSVKGIAEFTEEGVDIMTAGMMNFGNGLRASFNCGMNFDKDYPSRFDRLYIHGSKGYIKSDTAFNEDGELSYTLCVDGKKEVKTVSALQNYRLEVEQLGRCILEGETPLVSADFSIMNAETMDMLLAEIGY